MRKTLNFLLSLGLGLALGANAYSQSSQEKIPEIIKNKAAEYLKRVAYCPGDPIIEKIGEKFEDRTGPLGEKDGIKDKITLYAIKNNCPWINVPNYIIYTQIGLKKDVLSERFVIDEIISKDKDGKPVPLKEEWWTIEPL
jgi:hypothetical protein